MTTVKRFEDLPIWQEARKVVQAVYQTTKEFPSNEQHGLSKNMQQTAISTMSHIAEGFERGTNDEFIKFLHAAKGSNGRVRSQAYVALDLWYILQGECDNLVRHCNTLSQLVDKYIEQLKSNSITNETE